MTPRRLLPLLVMTVPVTGCTRAIDVDVAFQEGEPVLTFRTEGLFPHALGSICIWNAEIIDNSSGHAVMKLVAADYQQNCARVPRVTFARPEQGLKNPGNSGRLLPGRSYHAEVIADEGMGRSAAWRQQ